MDIGQFLIDNILNLAGIIGGGTLIGFIGSKVVNYLNKWIVKKAAQLRINTDAYIKHKVKDPFFRQLVLAEIALIQKEFSSELGKNKFGILKGRILAKVPDVLDKYVGEILQTIYDEAIKQK